MKSLSIVISIILLSFITVVAKDGWFSVDVPTDTNISCLDFYNDKLGVVLTEKLEVFLTLDGGNTFLNKTDLFPIKSDNNFYNVKCIKSNEIYVSLNGLIYLTKDTCNTWLIVNNTATNNDTLTCLEIHKYDSICYCKTQSEIYYSNNNLKSWSKIINSLKTNFTVSYTKTTFFKNKIAIIYYDNDVMMGPYRSIRFYNNNENISETDCTQKFGSLLSVRCGFGFIDDNNFIITNLGIYNTTDFGINWIKTFDYTEFGNISVIGSQTLYFWSTMSNSIIRMDNFKFTKCKVNDSVPHNLLNIKVVNAKVAFALLQPFVNQNKPTNYFLKTEDGGGVDLSDVEQEEIINPQIEFSTDLQLFDLLGRQIATYDNYYKLKTEIVNFTPPHLIM